MLTIILVLSMSFFFCPVPHNLYRSFTGARGLDNANTARVEKPEKKTAKQADAVDRHLGDRLFCCV